MKTPKIKKNRHYEPACAAVSAGRWSEVIPKDCHMLRIRKDGI